MIQRYLYMALKNGLEEIKTDPRILDELFTEQYGLPDDELDTIKLLFVEKTPNVVHSYARSDHTFPLYSLVLASEGEDEHFMAEDAAPLLDEDDEDYGSDLYSSIWEHTCQILCYSEHPDVTSYMYEVAKSIFLSTKLDLAREGFHDIHISGGELAPDPRYLPENLFVHQITFSAKREFQRTDFQARLTKAFRLGGIHVDKSGSPSDVGEVKTLITTYVSGVDDGESET